MRLIDADKLKQELEINGLGYQYYMLDNAPTVDAIPIDWIIKFSKKQKHGNYKDFIDFMIKYWESGHEL